MTTSSGRIVSYGVLAGVTATRSGSSRIRMLMLPAVKYTSRSARSRRPNRTTTSRASSQPVGEVILGARVSGGPASPASWETADG